MAMLVDTNIFIEFLRRVPVAVAWFEGQTDRLTISVITVLGSSMRAPAASMRSGTLLLCAGGSRVYQSVGRSQSAQAP